MLRATLFLSLCLPVAASAQSLTPTLIARTGGDVAGIPGATYTTLLGPPRLGAGGHVAFNSSITGGGSNSSDDSGYWVGTPGNLQIAIREDSAAVGGPTTFSSTSNAGVDANGRVATWTVINQSANMDQRLWGFLPDGNGGSTIVASEGVTAAPGFAGGLFSAIASGPASNNAGAVAFTGSVAGGDAIGTSDFGLFAGTPDNLKLVAREGTTAPGASGTATVFSTTTTVIFDKRINTSGQVGFAAALSGPGVTASNDRAIYVWTPNSGNGTLALAAQTGSPAPGTGSATIKFTLMDDQPGFNDAGQVAFRSSLTSEVPGELSLLNNNGIWAGQPGSVQLVVRGNDPTPIAGTTFRVPDVAPEINASGQVAFYSLISGTGVTTANDEVLWLKSASGFEAVARESTLAPGTTVNFGALDSVVALNNAGQLAFTAPLAGSGVNSTNDRGLWAGAPGELSLVAREGDVIDLDPGAGELLKTVSTISWASGFASPVTDSGSAAFNDAGQVAWQAQFTDATRAVFLTALLPDEPTLDGDYNDDGKVDAADYVVWRKYENTTTTLPNDPHGGTIGANQFNTWRANFGNMAGSGSVTLSAVPEPASFTMLASVFIGILTMPRRLGR